ncbi:MAG: oxygen-independent coproporphyrinogen III oxidase [Steroidobacterales bacterium]
MDLQVHFDPDLMRRYDREGPRYTSYPTALQFREGLDPAAYQTAAAASAGALDKSPLSIYVHIPFCQSPCFYCGCNKIVTRQWHRADPYVEDLIAEIALRSPMFDRSREVEQLHFGGGTPTFLSPQLLGHLLDEIGRNFQLTKAATRDYSIEIDPRTVDERYLQTLTDFGFNRISLGVQDFDTDVQRAVNRIQTVESVERLLVRARELGLRSINFDLIYGLPRQTLATFAATLDRVIGLRPDRLAVYGYAHMPRVFKGQRQIKSADLPDARMRLALLQLAVGKLTDAGYVYIGMDHFALPTDSLAGAQRDGTLHRSFQGYTTHASRDLVSFGVSAIGQVGTLYIQNYKALPQYTEAVRRGELPSQRGVTMSADDIVRRDVIQQVMCHGDVDIAATEARYRISFDGYFHAPLDRLQTLIDDGLVVRSPGHIRLTAAGRLLMRNVAMVFDAYARPAASADAPQLSRVI